jgi:probable rRNA maturation factor
VTAPQATLAVDLAFGADDDLPPTLRSRAADLADPPLAEDFWQRRLGTWLEQLRGELPRSMQAPAYSLGLRLVSDASIGDLNRQWRAGEGPTDVLAFAALDPGAGEAPPPPLPPAADLAGAEALELGDIVISLETAARQAEEAGHGLEHELLFLASHGLLHLLGWDHPDAASLTAMLERQERLLADPPPALPQT